ncbi:GNAT family N-acetyltransferase [Micromonospora lupini]|uniref:GCN5-related N-acetyltransferase n=1 Tax=Micromonospora lupini str. Lupac 08 TaxID=1150864 RepID=I0L309_9ACTN|nr:N-acetyltransferase [Micromonospora lupini]CCH18206.1 GCN5-related N-acetyltransferase [Micromonospora lupini str. Lupac 08]
MLIRRETPADVDAIRAVHAAAFATTTGDGAEVETTQAGATTPAPATPLGATPVEATLVDALRTDEGWLPAYSLVATDSDGQVVGHVVATRGRVGGAPVALGLGPLGVRPGWQRRGVGTALMHAVLGAADARDEPLVVLLGHPEYYPRFGFRPAVELGVTPPQPWGPRYFMARPLSAWRESIRGEFRYARPFDDL